MSSLGLGLGLGRPGSWLNFHKFRLVSVRHEHVRHAGGYETGPGRARPMKVGHVYAMYGNKLPTASTRCPTHSHPRIYAHLTRFISLGFVLPVLRYPIISIFFALSDTFFTYSVVDILRDWRWTRGVNKWKWKRNWRHWIGPPTGAMCLPSATLCLNYDCERGRGGGSIGTFKIHLSIFNGVIYKSGKWWKVNW